MAHMKNCHPVEDWGDNSSCDPIFLYIIHCRHVLFYCRDYSAKDLINFANNNPGVVVYLKPQRHRSPCIKAEYCKFDFGNRPARTPMFPLNSLLWLQSGSSTCMHGQSGYSVERLRKYQHTDFPSIQGSWTPWTHRHLVVNTVTFPAVSS
ncbi:large ribosomal subunit protein mL43-like [Oratosquilla oratoria]|uniref:large ribosomal subunit protein mL43-like n=1 Tax=Oratosquilla oratoria TaxID=337810 RepID=UPI003F76E5E2